MAAATAAPLEDSRADGQLPSAKEEARALFGLVERGASTAQAVRELIGVSPADEERIRTFAKTEPQFAHCVLPVLRFRRRVLKEFNRLTDESATKWSASVYVDARVETAAKGWNPAWELRDLPQGNDELPDCKYLETNHLQFRMLTAAQ